jgi:hypothetical protein
MGADPQAIVSFVPLRDARGKPELPGWRESTRGQWSLYWASKRTGTLFPPVVGRFADGRGEFYGDDTYNGKDIRARFVWSDITADSARWEQAFPVDGNRPGSPTGSWSSPGHRGNGR